MSHGRLEVVVAVDDVFEEAVVVVDALLDEVLLLLPLLSLLVLLLLIFFVDQALGKGAGAAAVPTIPYFFKNVSK